MAEYRVNLRRPGMTLMDLADLVAWLPKDSALARAVHPDEWEWGLDQHLLAMLVDAINHFEWSSSLGNPHLKGVDKKPPKPLPRPGVESDDKILGGKGALPMDEMAEWLGGKFAALNN